MTSLALQRRAPIQARARATVSAILEALAIELKKRPLEEVTTNRIADVAGVNIASLYQYFSCKEAIFDALSERQIETYRVALESAFEACASRPLDEGITLLLDAHVTTLARDAELHKVLLPVLMNGDGSEAYGKTRAAMVARLEGYLASRAHEVGPDDLAAAAQTCVECVEAVTFAALFRAGARLAIDPALQQLPRLARRYLLSAS